MGDVLHHDSQIKSGVYGARGAYVFSHTIAAGMAKSITIVRTSALAAIVMMALSSSTYKNPEGSSITCDSLTATAL
jgi:hypothetical protein